MELTNVTTVSELLEANKELTPLQKAVEALSECGYDDSKTVILWLVSNMLDFHRERACDDETPNPLQWAQEAGQLVVALEALKNTL